MSPASAPFTSTWASPSKPPREPTSEPAREPPAELSREFSRGPTSDHHAGRHGSTLSSPSEPPCAWPSRFHHRRRGRSSMSARWVAIGNADRSERSTHTLLEQMRRTAPLPAEPAKSKRIEKHGLPPDRLNADSGPGPSSTSAKTVFTVQACARTSIRAARATVHMGIGDRRAKFACRAVAP